MLHQIDFSDIWCARVYVRVFICCVFVSVACLCVTMPVRDNKTDIWFDKKYAAKFIFRPPDKHVSRPLKERSRFKGQGWLYCLIVEIVPGKPATVVLVPFLYILLLCCCETRWIKDIYELHVISSYVCNSNMGFEVYINDCSVICISLVSACLCVSFVCSS